MSKTVPTHPGLRALADVDAPEVVQVALRRFRRRVALFAGVGAFFVVGIVLIVTAPRLIHLSDRYEALSPVPLGVVVEDDGVRLLLVDAARLSPERYAVRAVAIADMPATDNLWAVTPSFPHGASGAAGKITEMVSMLQSPQATDMIFTMPTGEARAVIRIEGTQRGELVAIFELDLRELGVSAEVLED
jgi:hypothetical protein